MREELAARLPEETLRRTQADAAALLATDGVPPERVARRLLRAGRARYAVPLHTEAAAWAAGGGADRGAEWAELALEHADEQERPVLLALRSQLLHGAAEVRADAAYAEAVEVAAAERVPGLRAQQAGACLAAGNIPGAKAALEGAQPSGQKTSPR